MKISLMDVLDGTFSQATTCTLTLKSRSLNILHSCKCLIVRKVWRRWWQWRRNRWGYLASRVSERTGQTSNQGSKLSNCGPNWVWENKSGAEDYSGNETAISKTFCNLSRSTTKSRKWPVRPAKTQISLGIRPVWSEPSLSAWRNLGSLNTHWAQSEGSDQTGRMPRLIWVRWAHRPYCWFCHAAAHCVCHIRWFSLLTCIFYSLAHATPLSNSCTFIVWKLLRLQLQLTRCCCFLRSTCEKPKDAVLLKWFS